jgi:predicted TIM-barrel fold metal-dependent hydrolase
MGRYTVISADCHAGATYAEGGFLDYVEERHHAPLREEMARLERERDERMEKLFALEFMAEQDGTDAALGGGRAGAWEPACRLRELEADGIAAEVIFPDGSQNNAAPFQAAEGPGAIAADHALQGVGAWAYNRWLAEFCAHAAGRHAGLAIATLHDVDEAVRQIAWAADHGLRGVLLPSGVGELPFYHHPRYEPIWTICEERRLPLHTHVGSATPDYGDLPGSGALFAYESLWFSHRPFWFLVWGGVFERHPELKMVFAEQGADWVPDTTRILDNMYLHMFRHEQKRLSLKPSEYWQRQCYVEAMFLSRREARMRERIGVGNMLWGSDYPHYEGSWPRSKELIASALRDVAEDERRAILSENAAAVYGFDLAELDPIGARIGPEIPEAPAESRGR